MATIDINIDPSKSVEPIRDLADALDEINNKTDETEKSFRKTFGQSTKAVDGTTDAIQDQTKAQKTNADAVDQTKKGVVDFSKASKKAYDDKPVDEYTKSVKQADKATDDLDKSTDELGKSTGSVFEGLSDGLGEIGGEFGGIGEGLVSGEGGGPLGGLTSILGKIGPIGAAIAAVVGIVAALGKQIVEIDLKFDGLRGTVEELFQVTGDQADRIVVNAEAIADTFDQDVNEVLLTTNTLAKEFGLTGEEASNLLAKGFNSAANAQGDLIDGVKEFSSQIRASGGDADDLFAILEKSNEEGIFSDKGIDVVKEFGLRIREQSQGTSDALSAAFGADFTNNLLKGVNEGSITSIDALAKVSEELGGLSENSAAAQTVIADVFGGAGEDAGFRFLTLLKDINDEQGFGNRQLTEEQQRKQESLEANQRLASAQNDLSKAIGDSSVIGRVWTDVQTGFFRVLINVIEGVEDLIKGFDLLKTDPIEGLKLIGQVILDFISVPTNIAIDSANALINAFGFEDVIPRIDAGREAIRDFTDEQEKGIEVSRLAQDSIRKFGTETGILVGKLEKSFDAIQKRNVTDGKLLEITNKLNEAYPEQIGNIDLLTASNEELLQIKQDIIKAEVEASILQKKTIALNQLNLQISLRQAELESGVSDARRDTLEREIQFLEVNSKEKLALVEQETRVRLGLEEDVNEDIIQDADDTAKTIEQINAEAAALRKKQLDEFNKAIQDILKRGALAVRTDQFISEQERINLQRDFQREELANLLEHARALNESLTGSRELDQEVIDAFNRADEKLITDAQDKINAILKKKRMEERALQLKEDQEILNAKKLRFDQELLLLKSQEEEELAIIEQQTRSRGEGLVEFERSIELEKLQTQEFFLEQRLALIERERVLKVNAVILELEAIEEKEGAAVELQRQALIEKKGLLEQETSTQKEQLNLQLQNTKDTIDELENTVPTLGEFFSKIQDQIAESLGLDAEQLQAIVGAVKQVAAEIFNTIQEGVTEQIEANDEVLSKLDEREDKVKESLEREIAFAQAGYAANVDAKRQELLQIEEAQFEAQKQREKLLQQQALLDEISQISSLVTASASLYQSLAPLPFGIGIAIATALTAGMFAAFIATKAKARNVASLGDGGSGDTGTIHGKRHSAGGEPFLDNLEVEDGEMWSVYNRNGSSKYAGIIKDFTDAVNTDNMTKFMHKKSVPDIMIRRSGQVRTSEVELQGMVIAQDLSHNTDVLPQIKDALTKKFAEPERSFFTAADGSTYMFEKWPNGRTKKTKIRING